MQLRIKMALHKSKFDLEPMFESECRFDNDLDQSMQYLDNLFRVIMATQLQKEKGCN